jgi:hypothetical protein
VTKTNRRPEITKDGTARIISAPGGRWQVQRSHPERANTREHCGRWRSAGSPVSYAEARAWVGRELTEVVRTTPRVKRPRRFFSGPNRTPRRKR